MEISLSLDRIEGTIAVLLSEDGSVYETAAERLPEGHRTEGSVFLAVMLGGEIVSVTYAEEREKEAKERIGGLFEKLKNVRKNIKI